jgi:hypothetical protein
LRFASRADGTRDDVVGSCHDSRDTKRTTTPSLAAGAAAVDNPKVLSSANVALTRRIPDCGPDDSARGDGWDAPANCCIHDSAFWIFFVSRGKTSDRMSETEERGLRRTTD